MVSVPNLARGTVDRDEAVRKDSQARERVRRSKRARFLLVRGSQVASLSRGILALEWPQAEDFGAAEAIYLGEVAGLPYFACDVTGLDDEDLARGASGGTSGGDASGSGSGGGVGAASGSSDSSGTGTSGGTGSSGARGTDSGTGAAPKPGDSEPLRFEDLRVRAHDWPDDETALAVEAVSILQWRRVTRYCHECGEALGDFSGGWERRCQSGHSVFPRIDPAVIMAIRNGDDELLLGHNRAWAPGRYSVLAGFLEAGETLEAAVRREAFEEARVSVERVEYVSSQPWPFPRSLMLAFEGWTNGSQADVQVDGTEVEHARFFSRQDLKAAVAAGQVSLPNPTSIASMLIERWLGEPLQSTGWTSAELAHQPGRSPKTRG